MSAEERDQLAALLDQYTEALSATKPAVEMMLVEAAADGYPIPAKLLADARAAGITVPEDIVTD